MFAYLRVTYMPLSGNSISGTMEIAKKFFPGGQTTQAFEWKGENGIYDGGTWEWGKDRYGFVAMMLTSNLSKRMLGTLKGNTWNSAPTPPIEPWFRNGSKGFFTYIPSPGITQLCDWYWIR